MRSRDFIDYDDMIVAALRVLENESARLVEQNQVLPSLKMKLKTRPLFRPGYWKFSLTQPYPNAPANLIRVGDPNQAINSTFTPADPIYFRRFCEDATPKPSSNNGSGGSQYENYHRS